MKEKNQKFTKLQIFALVISSITLALVICVFCITATLFFFEEDSNTQFSILYYVESELEITSTSQVFTDITSPLVQAELNPNFENLMLINDQNPLTPQQIEVIESNLVTIEKEYRNNDIVTDIDGSVYHFMIEMLEQANSQGVNLKVWSPYRSYDTQKELFEQKVIELGGDEKKAATIVKMPGYSEHNSGLCADFNCADETFENSEMFDWLIENAENYGFILRYPKDKTDITGVIYEPWHWRFVGINNAKKMNQLNLCLEEYIIYLENINSFE